MRKPKSERLILILLIATCAVAAWFIRPYLKDIPPKDSVTDTATTDSIANTSTPYDNQLNSDEYNVEDLESAHEDGYWEGYHMGYAHAMQGAPFDDDSEYDSGIAYKKPKAARVDKVKQRPVINEIPDFRNMRFGMSWSEVRASEYYLDVEPLTQDEIDGYELKYNSIGFFFDPETPDMEGANLTYCFNNDNQCCDITCSFALSDLNNFNEFIEKMVQQYGEPVEEKSVSINQGGTYSGEYKFEADNCSVYLSIKDNYVDFWAVDSELW